MATIRYLVSDVDLAIAFYTEQLGFTLAKRWGPPFAVVARDDLRLWLSGPGSSAAKAMPDGRVPQPGGWNRIVIEVDNIDEWAARLTKAGVHFRNEATRGPGGTQILIEDPSGNPVELFQPMAAS